MASSSSASASAAPPPDKREAAETNNPPLQNKGNPSAAPAPALDKGKKPPDSRNLPENKTTNKRNDNGNGLQDSLPPNNAIDSTAASRVLSSLASSLLSSIAHPTGPSLTDALQSSSSKGSQQSLPSTTSSSSTWNESAQSVRPSSSTASTAGNFRTQDQPSSGSSAHDEFTAFAATVEDARKVPKVLSVAEGVGGDLQHFSHVTPPPYQFDPEDGSAVSFLLAAPLTGEVYSPLPGTPNPHLDISHPVIRSFIECEDPVAFLESGAVYTDDVWGDLVGLMREAREEIAHAKGKERDTAQEGIAVERLKAIWGQLRGSKL